MSKMLIRPPMLTRDSCVAVVAPASPFPAQAFEVGMALLSERYDVRVRPDIAARDRYLAGDDARRLRELQDAIDDPAIRAIFCVCGGYGATRLLDRLDTTHLQNNPKWLIGFSDITALHARWALAGVQSIHGPTVQGLSRASDDDRAALFAAVEDSSYAPRFDGLTVLNRDEATGPLLGGNLALLCALMGTDDAPPLAGSVLLMEDVNESPYRVDRLLTQLRRAGVLDRVAGVAVGRFNKSEPGEDGTTVEQVIAERLSGLRCPVVTGLPIGHDGPNAAVRLGGIVRIAGDRLECIA